MPPERTAERTVATERAGPQPHVAVGKARSWGRASEPLESTGALEQTRTADRLLTMQVLYRLSYEGSDPRLPDTLPKRGTASIWSGKRGSNPRPSAWKADALPSELFPLECPHRRRALRGPRSTSQRSWPAPPSLDPSRLPSGGGAPPRRARADSTRGESVGLRPSLLSAPAFLPSLPSRSPGPSCVRETVRRDDETRRMRCRLSSKRSS